MCRRVLPRLRIRIRASTTRPACNPLALRADRFRPRTCRSEWRSERRRPRHCCRTHRGSEEESCMRAASLSIPQNRRSPFRWQTPPTTTSRKQQRCRSHRKPRSCPPRWCQSRRQMCPSMRRRPKRRTNRSPRTRPCRRRRSCRSPPRACPHRFGQWTPARRRMRFHSRLRRRRRWPRRPRRPSHRGLHGHRTPPPESRPKGANSRFSLCHCGPAASGAPALRARTINYNRSTP
jgi:hypothetical protein